MGGIHFDGNSPQVVHGDIVGGDKITTIVSAAVRAPTTLIERAEEAILDASELAFGEARDLLKALRVIRKAKKTGTKEEIKKAIDELGIMPGSQVIVAFISELKNE